MYLRNSQVVSLVKGELGCCLPSMGSLAVISSVSLDWNAIYPVGVHLQ